MSEMLVNAQVEQIVPLTDSIIQLLLKPEHYIDYQAGQYLNLMCDGQEFSYSIANAPLGAHNYQLHIRHSVDNPYNQLVLAHIKKHGCISLKAPLGTCSLNQLAAPRPILFIAGGTGFAPVHAMIEQLLADADTRPVELYWSARSISDLYLEPKVLNWQAHVSHFSYFPFLSDDNKDNLLTHLLARHAADLLQWQFVLSGPFDMVYRIRDALVACGVHREDLFSDAFSFE